MSYEVIRERDMKTFVTVITAGEFSLKYCGLRVNGHLFSGNRCLEILYRCRNLAVRMQRYTKSSGAAISLLLALRCGFSRANNVYKETAEFVRSTFQNGANDELSVYTLSDSTTFFYVVVCK